MYDVHTAQTITLCIYKHTCITCITNLNQDNQDKHILAIDFTRMEFIKDFLIKTMHAFECIFFFLLDVNIGPSR